MDQEKLACMWKDIRHALQKLNIKETEILEMFDKDQEKTCFQKKILFYFTEKNEIHPFEQVSFNELDYQCFIPHKLKNSTNGCLVLFYYNRVQTKVLEKISHQAEKIMEKRFRFETEPIL